MRKYLVVMGLILGLSFSICYAASLTSNASPLTVALSTSTPYRNEAINPPSRNIDILNNGKGYVWITFASPSSVGHGYNSYLLAPSQQLCLYDFITEYISLEVDKTGTYGATNASPISVMVTR